MHQFLMDGLTTLFWTVVSLAVSWLVFRLWVLQKLRKEVDESFYWCAVMLFTVELRLTKLDERVRAVLERSGRDGLSGDPEFGQLLQAMQADIEAFQTAADALMSTLSLPLASPVQEMRLAGFAASSSRWVSELARTVTVLEYARDRGMSDGDLRYVKFLMGGPSPVIGGRQAKDPERARTSGLRMLLNTCLSQLNSLSRSFRGGQHTDYCGTDVWRTWTGWQPAPLPEMFGE